MSWNIKTPGDFINGPLTVAASATITGDLTVDTSTLKVDSANNRVGVNKAAPAYALDVVGNATISSTFGNNNWFYIAGNGNTVGAASFDIGQSASNEGYVFNRANGPIIFGVNNTTAMTLNSTGLGIGIAPDSAKATRLSVYQTGDLTDETAPFSVGNTAAGGMRLYAGVNNTNEYVYIGSVKSGTGYRSLILQPNGGNVGVGVTPSAWGSGKAIEVLEKGYGIWNGSGSSYLLANAYFNSGFKYANTGSQATHYYQYQGTHVWSTAPSGTAGNAITFTQAMTLDASGNLILLSSNTPATLATNGQLTVNATSNTNLRFSYRGSDGTTRVANITLA